MPSQMPNEKHALDAAANLSDTISEAATAARGSVSDLGRTAAAKIDENRDAAARGLHTAATSLHNQADGLPGGEKVTSLAHSAADTLSSTADYVRDHDVSGMMADVERLVKNNPGPSLLAAAAIGFLVGRTLSHD
jgi:ElaB/YqjD/DUF883 family membrane-anchored ribosome-binding protein